MNTIVSILIAAVLVAPAGDKGRLLGRVVDQKGRAVAGARVSAEAGGARGEATTDAKGEYAIELDPGAYRIRAEAEGFSAVALSDPVTVEAGRDVKRKLELQPIDTSSVIRGSVFSADGRSLPGAKLVVERVAGAGDAVRLKTNSDRSGVFSFHVPGEGSYRVTAAREGYTPNSITVDVSNGEITNVAIRLASSGESLR